MPWTMQTLYMGCAALGGTVLVVQLLLLFLGGDADDFGDVGPDGDVGDGSVGLLSIRAVAGFLTFFGLAGWWGTADEWGPALTLAVATLSGGAMMLAVAWLMNLQRKLQLEGNLDPRRAVGLPAQVYLRIPGEHSGKGKITVSLQGRSVQFGAVTQGPELPTGSQVRIERMTTSDTFEVKAL